MTLPDPGVTTPPTDEPQTQAHYLCVEAHAARTPSEREACRNAVAQAIADAVAIERAKWQRDPGGYMGAWKATSVEWRSRWKTQDGGVGYGHTAASRAATESEAVPFFGARRAGSQFRVVGDWITDKSTEDYQ